MLQVQRNMIAAVPTLKSVPMTAVDMLAKPMKKAGMHAIPVVAIRVLRNTMAANMRPNKPVFSNSAVLAE